MLQPTSIKEILRELSLSPRKGLGQNFLIDQRLVNTIIEAADIKSADIIIEIGPGLGIVTQPILQTARKVIAVELDQKLAIALEQKIQNPSFTVIYGDARKVDVDAISSNMRYKLVANLPYYAASPILRHFLESHNHPTKVVAMLQREVAQNIVAEPGNMSLMSVGIQLYGKPTIVTYVPPSAFYPKPKVTSAIIHIDVYNEPLLKLDNRDAFFKIVRAGFSAPRKQLHNSLSYGLQISQKQAMLIIEKAYITPTRRPATLTLHEWKDLYDVTQKEDILGNHRSR
jgi:16S rRNA (adenine1518-N6/adenine1519-N6)-dimethyltransferase